MHFARLRLSGFKSFVDPTELLIEPGLTGVVGPNGCGKSNLLEAIRWVMGENRAKSLRGSGMDDVIFSGTDRRPPRNLAEVTLVLDNFERDAPAAHNSDDIIEVTRRIERESGSAYRINGGDVRQKDVQLLFADAATGAHSPALVSQGRIGSLINAKPQDRRQILEEAAGISGLHTRRKEAESRLRGAEGNLVRLQDVIQAMESQIASLKRQAKQAVRYRTISTDIRQAEASLLFLRWKMSADEVIELERVLRAAESEVAKATAHVSVMNREQVELASVLPSLREKDAETAAALQRLNIEKENLETEEERRRQTALSLRSTLTQIASDREREKEIASDSKASLERLAKEKDRLESAQAAEKDAQEEAKEALESAGGKANEAEQAFDTLSEQTAGVRARKSSLESDHLAISRRMEQIEMQVARLTREAEQLAASNDAASKMTEAETAVKAAEEKLEKATESLSGAEQATQQARTARSEAESLKSERLSALRTLEGEVKSLTALISSGEGTDDTPVSDQMSVKAGYEVAIGAALGEDAENGIDREADKYWAGTKAESIEFDWPAGVDPIGAYVSVPRQLQARTNATGLITDHILSVDAYIAALKPGQRLVTRDGAVYRWDGFIMKAGAPSAAALRLERRNRLQALEGDVQTAQEAADHAQQAASGSEYGAQCSTGCRAGTAHHQVRRRKDAGEHAAWSGRCRAGGQPARRQIECHS